MGGIRFNSPTFGGHSNSNACGVSERSDLGCVRPRRSAIGCRQLLLTVRGAAATAPLRQPLLTVRGAAATATAPPAGGLRKQALLLTPQPFFFRHPAKLTTPFWLLRRRCLLLLLRASAGPCRLLYFKPRCLFLDLFVCLTSIAPPRCHKTREQIKHKSARKYTVLVVLFAI